MNIQFSQELQISQKDLEKWLWAKGMISKSWGHSLHPQGTKSACKFCTGCFVIQTPLQVERDQHVTRSKGLEGHPTYTQRWDQCSALQVFTSVLLEVKSKRTHHLPGTPYISDP